MKTTIPKLRRMVRNVITEMYQGGMGFPDPELEQDIMDGAQGEPHSGYVEGMAAAMVEDQAGRLDWDEYRRLGWDYGYRTDEDIDQLEEWWEAAVEEMHGHSFRAGFGDGFGPRYGPRR